jgi:enoyl-[acyl-carrier protein] reductase II
MTLGGEEIALHRFTNFPPTPDTTGDIDEMPFLAGQGVGLIREIMSVGRIVEELMTEALVVLAASLPDDL